MSLSTSNWTFKDYSNWGGICNSNVNQSPINIDTELTIQCESLCDLKFFYKPSKCNVKFNNGMIILKYDKDSYILYKNVYYKLEYITVHTPTMHQIDGEKYDMEVIMVHSTGNPNEGGVTISCMFEEGPHFGKAETFFSQFINDTPSFKSEFEETVEVSSVWGADMLLPDKRSFYVYEGSLPYPPCSGKYFNIVLERTGTIGSTNLGILKKYLTGNIRNIQSIGTRKVFYSLGKDIIPSERKESVTDDKFLRCVRKTISNVTKKPSKRPPDNYIGCYKDGSKSKALSNKVGFVDSPEVCNEHAIKNKVNYFGLYEATTVDRNGTTTKQYRCSLPKDTDNFTQYGFSDDCIQVDDTNFYHGDDKTVAVYRSTGDYSYFSFSMKARIRTVIMFICLGMLMANAFFLTKYLFKEKITQKILISIVGVQNLNFESLTPEAIIQKWENRCVPKRVGVNSSSSSDNPRLRIGTEPK